MLGALPDVLVPGFEPLDNMPELGGDQKMAFLEAAFSWPRDNEHFARWRRALEPVPRIRLHRERLATPQQLDGKAVAGFKLRPFVSTWGEPGARAHTAMTGAPPSCTVQRRPRSCPLLLLAKRWQSQG
jgi:hypothetical protein